jgi:Domain of unknown function (DUF6896)
LRRPTQQGMLADPAWAYFFHGFECDLRNQKDGRSLRIDFGPKGQVGILNDWGVLRFIMTSVPPWREFPALRMLFAKSGPPFDEHSGDYQKLLPVWSQLKGKGFFEPADPGLVALLAQHTTREPGGPARVQFPPNVSEETRLDCLVAHRQRLSQPAIHILATHGGAAPLAHDRYQDDSNSNETDFAAAEWRGDKN